MGMNGPGFFELLLVGKLLGQDRAERNREEEARERRRDELVQRQIEELKNK